MDRYADTEVAKRIKATIDAEAEAKARAKLEQIAGHVVLPQEIYRPNPKGLSLSFSSAPVGVTWQVRFVSEILPLFLHFEAGGVYVCFGSECRRCPDNRSLYGYADALIVQPDGETGRPTARRFIQALTDKAVQALTGKKLRGCLVEIYRRGKTSRSQVSVLETSCPFALPEPCDMKAVLMRRYQLPSWPVQQAAEETGEQQPDILKFQPRKAQ
jgi:hypothetical protein